MNNEIITALIAFAFVSSITPGPNNLMLLTSGTNFGFKHTIPHILGIVTGFTVMVVLVGVGLLQLFDAFPLSYLMLKVLSVAYLFYLAWKIATSAPLENDDTLSESKPKPFTFLQAALFQWVNPKAWAVALTAISVYTPPFHAIINVVMVAVIFGAVTLPSTSAWVLIGAQMRRFLTDPFKLRVFNVCAALLLIGSLYPILFSAKI
ncbi:LysE family translocator [Candidatus Spongiihabitans sp.]|uniref:LysE family translocator n=1 Tax=Candidatus Spongiihabitans sp. TaxID=3101308 RepID=UPI003C704BC1